MKFLYGIITGIILGVIIGSVLSFLGLLDSVSKELEKIF